MKRFWIVFMLLGLLLTGCTNREPDTEITEATETTAPELYQEHSAIEQATGGAVRRYDLPGTGYSWLSAIGDKLLLAQCADGKTKLTVLSGTDYDIGATAELPVDLSLENACWQTTHGGFAYYDPQTHKVVFLDPQLQLSDEVDMPEDMTGDPVISADGGEIFYCTTGQIRVMETEHKISRLIKSHDCVEQKLLGAYFNGDVVACYIEDIDNHINVHYLSSENGQTIVADNDVDAVYTYENMYLALRQEGVVQQSVVGFRDGTPMDMQVDTQLASVLELGGIVGYAGDETGMTFSLYMLDPGTKTGEVTVTGIGMPRQILADRWSSCVWVLTTDAQTGANILLRWDPSMSVVEDGEYCLGTLYTAQSPDEDGLEACEDRAERLSNTYGVTMRVWKNAAKYSTGHLLDAEYLVPQINDAMDELEQILTFFPRAFIRSLAEKPVRVCIVRSVDNQIGSATYWYQDNAYIAISAHADITAEFTKCLGKIIDEYVMNETSAYSEWSSLNPEGFVYADEATYSDSYLTGETMAFASREAMTSAEEDRAYLFQQAMLPDNGQVFQNPIMQQKLALMCRAIREAWNLKWKTDTYQWEQYLSE